VPIVSPKLVTKARYPGCGITILGVGADYSSFNALIGNLTVDINGFDVTVASVQLAGTGVAMTADIVSTMGSRQIFEKVKYENKLAKPGTLWQSRGAFPI